MENETLIHHFKDKDGFIKAVTFSPGHYYLCTATLQFCSLSSSGVSRIFFREGVVYRCLDTRNSVVVMNSEVEYEYRVPVEWLALFIKKPHEYAIWWKFPSAREQRKINHERRKKNRRQAKIEKKNCALLELGERIKRFRHPDSISLK